MKNIIEYMLREDQGFGDITSNALIPDDLTVDAKIISKDEGIVAGINIIEKIFEDYDIGVIKLVSDGSKISEGDVLLELRGNAKTILILERTALNIFMRMSGIATITNEIVEKVHKVNPKVKIAGTRKTAPAFSEFDKLAIGIGGGDTHRFSLDDMILIKDNHISAVGSPIKALKLAKKNASFSKKIEIEVESIDDAIMASKEGADIVMLDNFSPNLIKECISILNKFNLRDNILIEISGGINKYNILDYSNLDIDIISLGALTHSVKSLDLSLNIVK